LAVKTNYDGLGFIKEQQLRPVLLSVAGVLSTSAAIDRLSAPVGDVTMVQPVFHVVELSPAGF
jgi:hypothetical protein